MRYPMRSVVLTEDDVRKGLRAIKQGKQPGPDGLKGELYWGMAGGGLLVEILTCAYNEVIANHL